MYVVSKQARKSYLKKQSKKGSKGTFPFQLNHLHKKPNAMNTKAFLIYTKYLQNVHTKNIKIRQTSHSCQIHIYLRHTKK